MRTNTSWCSTRFYPGSSVSLDLYKSENLQTTVKIFADDTYLFSVVNDPVSCANKLNVDLEVINEWADQWKMSFDQWNMSFDPSKQAVQIHAPGITFNGCIVSIQEFHKHLAILFDRKLTLNIIWEWKFPKLITELGLFLGCVRSSLEILAAFGEHLGISCTVKLV